MVMDLEDEDRAAEDDEGTLLAAALACLPEMEAKIIQLHDESGLSFEEIGQAIGLEPGSARAAWARGLRELTRVCRSYPVGAAHREPEARRSPLCDSSLGG